MNFLIKYILLFFQKKECITYGTYRWDIEKGYPDIIEYNVTKCYK